MKLVLTSVISAAVLMAAGVPNKAAGDETLRYSINWPSGLSLGEAVLTSSRGEDGKARLNFKAEAPMPGFPLVESAESQTDEKGCSIELKKEAKRGARKVEEKTTFDQAKLTGERKTASGGKTDLTLSPCAKDALAYLYFLRRELAGGRLPAAEKVYYGAAYDVRVSFLGTERVVTEEKPVDADRLSVTIKGPASDFTAEILFARDQQRTPVMIRLPLSMGKFTLELMR